MGMDFNFKFLTQNSVLTLLTGDVSIMLGPCWIALGWL